MDKDKLAKLRERNRKAIALLEKWQQEPALMTQEEWDDFYSSLIASTESRVLEFTIKPPSRWSASKMWTGFCRLNKDVTANISVRGDSREDCIRLAKKTVESFGCVYKTKDGS